MLKLNGQSPLMWAEVGEHNSKDYMYVYIYIYMYTYIYIYMLYDLLYGTCIFFQFSCQQANIRICLVSIMIL